MIRALEICGYRSCVRTHRSLNVAPPISQPMLAAHRGKIGASSIGCRLNFGAYGAVLAVRYLCVSEGGSAASFVSADTRLHGMFRCG